MDVAERITQFEHMCEADPENDMAWFSLGKAYLDAGRPAEAAEALRKCITLNDAMTKAYQLAGEALIQSGDSAGAKEALTTGYVEAGRRGDLMPKNAMGALLESIGAPIPEAEAQQAETAAADAGFVCKRSGRPGAQMEAPPFRGPIGAWIRENISRETWSAWIGQGTKVINELRLDFSREEDQRAYDQHMYEFLGLDEETRVKLLEQESASA